MMAPALIDTLDGLVTAVRAGTVAPLAIVDQVFDVFDKGGAGQLAAWPILSQERGHLDPVWQAVNDLVEAIAGKFPNLADADARVRSSVLLVGIGAFGVR